MCGASRDLLEGVRIWTMNVYRVPACLYWTALVWNKGMLIWKKKKKRICLQCRRCRKHWLDPWVANITWERKWQPTRVFLPGKSHEQKSPVDYSPIWSQRVQHNWACTHARHADSFWFSKPERETWVFAVITSSQVMLCCWPRDYTLRSSTPGTWNNVYSLWPANHNRE